MATILAAHPHLVEATLQPVAWQEAVRRAIRDPRQLLSALGLPADLSSQSEKTRAAEQQFPLFVPWEFVARMQPARSDDPLLRQVMVCEDEVRQRDGFVSDPVDDAAAEVLPGLLKKYASRALLLASGACAIHCRYCFRREYPYGQAPKNPAGWQAALNHIAVDPSIEELILSGGDPLMQSDRNLSWLVARVNDIPHVVRLRVHTRLPVVIPQRVCDAMLQWIAAARMQVILVTHINHPQEIDTAVRDALLALRSAGVLLLNQAVLLRGVNDDVSVLRNLSSRLIECGVLPYYLHQLDRVRGAAHFEVSIDRGREIIEELRAQFSGYGVPMYVAEQPGYPNKRPL